MASFHPSPTRPKLELPAGACDTHFHVFGPTSRFPFAADRSYTPAGDAPKETLFALHRHLGIERGVVVQSAAHGMDNSAAADRSPVPVVIDHMARVDASLGLEQSPFRELLRLLEDRKFWVKLSGCERASRQSAPWRDAVPFARKLVAEFGERTLWRTDWPHPNLKEIPDDGVVVDLLGEIAPGASQRQALLVDNPQRFYGFE